jgi:hypothetical protein
VNKLRIWHGIGMMVFAIVVMCGAFRFSYQEHHVDALICQIVAVVGAAAAVWIFNRLYKELDAPEPEKPKRKGKPINWDHVGWGAGIVVGAITGVIVTLVVGGWIGQAAETLSRAMFPDGLPYEQKQLLDLMNCLSIPIMISAVLSLLGFIVGKLK